MLNLKETLAYFVEHRRDVVTRRTRFELRQAEAQREIVEGLGMATPRSTSSSRRSASRATPTRRARSLMELPLQGPRGVRAPRRPARGRDRRGRRRSGDYFLSERQAKAILEMRLSRLTGLEREKLAAEYGELCDEIARLRAILADESAAHATSS